MYRKQGEIENAGESEGLLLKEVKLKVSFESVQCGCFPERERGEGCSSGEGRTGVRSRASDC